MKSEIISQNFRPGLNVFYGPHAASALLLKFCAHAAVSHAVLILDFGNRSDMYFTARELRPLTRDPVAAMRNIRLRRAFTGYQAVSVLEQSSHICASSILILDLLSLFLDESIPTKEAERLFQNSIHYIFDISRQTSVIAGVNPVPSIIAERSGFLTALKNTADTFQLVQPKETAPLAAPQQPSLFGGT